MSEKINQNKLIDLALGEINKMIDDLKAGKTPAVSGKIQKLSEEMASMNEKSKTMTEEEVEAWAKQLNEHISNME